MPLANRSGARRSSERSNGQDADETAPSDADALDYEDSRTASAARVPASTKALLERCRARP